MNFLLCFIIAKKNYYFCTLLILFPHLRTNGKSILLYAIHTSQNIPMNNEIVIRQKKTMASPMLHHNPRLLFYVYLHTTLPVTTSLSHLSCSVSFSFANNTRALHILLCKLIFLLFGNLLSRLLWLAIHLVVEQYALSHSSSHLHDVNLELFNL